MGSAPLTAQDIGGTGQGPGGLLDGADDQMGGVAVPEGGGGQGIAVLAGGVQQGGGGLVHAVRVNVYLLCGGIVQDFQQRPALGGGGWGEPAHGLLPGKMPLPPQGRVQVQALLRRDQGVRLQGVLVI